LSQKANADGRETLPASAHATRRHGAPQHRLKLHFPIKSSLNQTDDYSAG
jgi:hypothetical protein